MTIRLLAAAGAVLVALMGCGSDPGLRVAGFACDPGGKVYEAVSEDPVVRDGGIRPEVGTADGVRAEYSPKTRECGPIVFTRQWELEGAEPEDRAASLDDEIQAAGWTPRPQPARDEVPCDLDAALSCKAPSSSFTIARDYEKRLGGVPVTLAVSYRPGEPALTGLVRASVEPQPRR